MPDRAKKKQLKRLKREEKRARHQKLANLSPFKKVEMFSELSACYLNPNWRERGQAVGFIVRQMRDGSMAMTSFLIDTWCAGLKNIWARFDLQSGDIANSVRCTGDNMETTLVRITPEETRALLAAGIRFARENGFRLPADLQKCLGFIGPIGSIEDADLTGFGFEGDPTKLQWCAPLHDLRKRLVGCSVEEFLAKPNVQFVAGADHEDFADFEDIDDDDDDDRHDRLLDRFEELADFSVPLIETWLRKHGENPVPELPTAFRMMLAGSLLRFAKSDDDDVMAAAAMELVLIALNGDQSQIMNPSEGIKVAQAQVESWLNSFSSRDDAFNYLTDKLNEQTLSG